MKRRIVLIILAGLLSACDTAVPSPTSTPLPTRAAATMAVHPADTPTPLPTSTPVPTFTPAPSESHATPDPDSSPACARPPDDMTHVQIDGETVSARTLWMLRLAQHLYGGPGDILSVTQGSYTPGLKASFGTHNAGGAVDISIVNPSNKKEILWNEASRMVAAMRQAGFAAWYRTAEMFGPGSGAHIHAIAVGDPELSPAARRQIDGPEGYLRGLDGVIAEYGGPHPDLHGGPVMCPWMLEMGYKDMRPTGE